MQKNESGYVSIWHDPLGETPLSQMKGDQLKRRGYSVLALLIPKKGYYSPSRQKGRHQIRGIAD